MSKVMIHATVSVDGFMADPDGGMDWMNGFPVASEDEQIVEAICSEIGSIVGGANKTQIIEEGEIPYGGFLKVPVYLMTHREQESVEQDGTRFIFVVDDIEEAVRRARYDAGEKWVSLLGGPRRKAVPRPWARGRTPAARRAGCAGRRHTSLRRPGASTPPRTHGNLRIRKRGAPPLPGPAGYACVRRLNTDANLVDVFWPVLRFAGAGATV